LFKVLHGVRNANGYISIEEDAGDVDICISNADGKEKQIVAFINEEGYLCLPSSLNKKWNLQLDKEGRLKREDF